MNRIRTILTERTSTRVLLLSIFVGIVGISLIYLSTNTTDVHLGPLLKELGSLLLVTVVISLLWELGAKRAFFDETWAKAGLAYELIDAGLTSFTDNFQLVPYHELLKNINRLDILFAYAETWRNYYYQQLELIAQNKGARIRVILPDPYDQQVVSELSRRFQSEPDILKTRIKSAKDFFMNDLHRKYPDGAQIQIWYLSRAPHHTFYIMDTTAVMALYYYRRGRGCPVPTFTVRKGGRLYQFLIDDFEEIIKDPGLARAVND